MTRHQCHRQQASSRFGLLNCRRAEEETKCRYRQWRQKRDGDEFAHRAAARNARQKQTDKR